MWFRTTGSMLLTTLGLMASATAQTTPPASAIARTVIAAAKLPMTNERLYFKGVSVTVPPGETSNVSSPNGILYQTSGSTEVSVGGEAKMLSAGEGLFIANGKPASLKAGGGEPSTLLHFIV